MKNYDIKGFIIKKNFFTEKEISNFEKNIVFFIAEYCEKKSTTISKKAKRILNYSKNKFKVSAIKLLEEIEKKNKKLFYEISTECSKIYSINNPLLLLSNKSQRIRTDIDLYNPPKTNRMIITPDKKILE